MFDLHIHTCYSKDGHEKTDHNTVEASLKKYHFREFIIIPGIEVSSDRGHILGIGIQDRIKKRRAEDVIDEIHDNGGVAILAHPYRMFSGAIKNFEGLKFDGIETFNARSFPSQNRKAANLAIKKGGAITGGSDAHHLWEAGRGYTVMEAAVHVHAFEILRECTAFLHCQGIQKGLAPFVPPPPSGIPESHPLFTHLKSSAFLR